MIAILDAPVPAGASIGALIVHASPELTMLFGRIFSRFQTGIPIRRSQRYYAQLIQALSAAFAADVLGVEPSAAEWVRPDGSVWKSLVADGTLAPL